MHEEAESLQEGFIGRSDRSPSGTKLLRLLEHERIVPDVTPGVTGRDVGGKPAPCEHRETIQVFEVHDDIAAVAREDVLEPRDEWQEGAHVRLGPVRSTMLFRPGLGPHVEVDGRWLARHLGQLLEELDRIEPILFGLCSNLDWMANVSDVTEDSDVDLSGGPTDPQLAYLKYVIIPVCKDVFQDSPSLQVDPADSIGLFAAKPLPTAYHTQVNLSIQKQPLIRLFFLIIREILSCSP